MIQRELEVWSKLDHPNILKFLGTKFLDRTCWLISPWCKFGHALAFLEEHPNADREVLVRLFVSPCGEHED